MDSPSAGFETCRWGICSLDQSPDCLYHARDGKNPSFSFLTQRRIYQNKYPYFVTSVTKNRARLFTSTETAEALGNIILSACTLKGFCLYGYCILPDHFHLLVGTTERRFRNLRSNKEYTISDLLHSIKRNFSREKHEGNIWQPRFHVRLIDTPSYLQNIVAYITNNYQKERLPASFGAAPFVYLNTEKIGSLI